MSPVLGPLIIHASQSHNEFYLYLTSAFAYQSLICSYVCTSVCIYACMYVCIYVPLKMKRDLRVKSKKFNIPVPYKMKIWRRIYFGGLTNYKNLPN